MSDPAKNSEIEDVLSSIRRLVSEEARPVVAPQPPAKPDRLVLTPALRVAEAAPREEVAEQPESIGEEAAVDTPEEMQAHEAEPAEAEAYAEEQSEGDSDAQSDTHAEADAQDDNAHNDDQGQDAQEAAEDQSGQDTASEPSQDDQPQAQDDVDPWTDLAPELTETEEETSLTPAEPEQAQDATEPEKAQDVNEPEEAQKAEASEQAPATDAEQAADLDASDDEAEEHEQREAAETVDFNSLRNAPLQDFEEDTEEAISAMAQAAVSSALMDRISRMEAVMADQSGEWEPEADATDAAAEAPTEVLAWEDHVEGPTVGNQPEVEDLGDAAQQDTPEAQFRHSDPAAYVAASAFATEVPEPSAEDEAAFLDEEALRELVADIVRQELQGALGERITRNVRKLVRREIHRALASHELD